jgi:hypothetical protein
MQTAEIRRLRLRLSEAGRDHRTDGASRAVAGRVRTALMPIGGGVAPGAAEPAAADLAVLAVRARYSQYPDLVEGRTRIETGQPGRAEVSAHEVAQAEGGDPHAVGTAVTAVCACPRQEV